MNISFAGLIFCDLQKYHHNLQNANNLMKKASSNFAAITFYKSLILQWRSLWLIDFTKMAILEQQKINTYTLSQHWVKMKFYLENKLSISQASHKPVILNSTYFLLVIEPHVLHVPESKPPLQFPWNCNKTFTVWKMHQSYIAQKLLLELESLHILHNVDIVMLMHLPVMELYDHN